MRYCRNCDKWNTGYPLRCHYCSAGLEGRLCPSGHVNPPDAGLSYCGDCGKPLEQKWGAGFSAKPYLLALGVVVLTMTLAALFAYAGQCDCAVMTAIIALIIVVIGLRLAFRILPPWVARFVADAVTFFMRVVLGTGLKGKK